MFQPQSPCANTGISAAFDARGHELAHLDMQTTGVLPVHLPLPLVLPLYARVGLLLPGGVAALVLMIGLARNPRRRRVEPANL